MRFKKVVSVLVLVTLISATFGCLDDVGISKSSAKDMLKMIPEGGSGFGYYIDFKTIKEDKDLRVIYKKLTNEFSKSDMDIDDLDFVFSDRDLRIFGGGFDKKKVKDELKDHDYDKYNGVDLWTKKSEYSSSSEAVAIVGDKLIVGDEKAVKNYIKVIKGSQTTMYEENDDFRDVVNKLPQGIYVMTFIDRKETGGFALLKEDKNTMELKGVFKYKDEDDAEDAVSDIKSSFKRKKGLSDLDVKQNGKYVEISAKGDIEDWESLMPK